MDMLKKGAILLAWRCIINTPKKHCWSNEMNEQWALSGAVAVAFGKLTIGKLTQHQIGFLTLYRLPLLSHWRPDYLKNNFPRLDINGMELEKSKKLYEINIIERARLMIIFKAMQALGSSQMEILMSAFKVKASY